MHRNFYVFDLDGTLANIEHRAHYVRNGNRQWDKFFAECVNDSPNIPVIEVLQNLILAGNEVEIWSGRSDAVRKETEQWLDDHIPLVDDMKQPIDASSLLTRMRPADDYQKDSLLKKSWLDETRANGDNVISVFDDRQQVVDMWREENLTCFQVAPGDFDEPKVNKRVVNRTPRLIMMVGPSGAGKSTIIANSIASGVWHRNQVVSTDDIREEIWGHRNASEAFTQENFGKPHQIAHSQVINRLKLGLKVVHDATNIKPKDRKTLLNLVDKEVDGPYDVVYVIVDRPLEEKLATMDQQKEEIVRKHHDTFKQNIKYALNGDGNPDIEILDTRNF